ncbi:hypothetical protein [Streptomyces sp. NPDC048266]|uniref:hypothetical protein n=1 Tax=Streptomyces sp. NPDC048266 TaxID=3155787 RepID=UPI0033CE18A4
MEALEQLLQKPEVRSWVPEDWEQVRDLSVGRMQRSPLPAEIRIRWGAVALSAISRKYADGQPQQAVADMTRVRAYMIAKFGVSDTDVDRDLSALCSDVLRHLGLSYEAAVRLAGEWPGASRKQMLHLRRIKNMLTALAPVRALLDDDDPDVRETLVWLDLVPRLP